MISTRNQLKLYRLRSPTWNAEIEEYYILVFHFPSPLSSSNTIWSPFNVKSVAAHNRLRTWTSKSEFAEIRDKTR